MSEKVNRVNAAVDELVAALKDLFGDDIPPQLTMMADPIKMASEQYEMMKEQNKHGDA